MAAFPLDLAPGTIHRIHSLAKSLRQRFRPLIGLLLLLSMACTAIGQRVTYNFLIDPDDRDTRAVMAVLEGYLAADPHLQQPSPYWNAEDQARHRQYDFLAGEFHPSLYMGLPAHVLSIRFDAEGVCHIQVQFSASQEDGTPNVLAIAQYVAQKDSGQYKLYNHLTFSRRDWVHNKVGIIDFYSPPSHRFDRGKAQRLHDFTEWLCRVFEVAPTPFEYYLADDLHTLQRLKGLDYALGTGGPTLPSGKTNDDKVYCGGLGEYYAHEVCHVQLNRHFPDQHFWAAEGLATLVGGSRGQSLAWHIRRTHQHLLQHPEVDLNNLLALRNLDVQTAYHYVLGGLIAQRILEAKGMPGLRQLMTSGKEDADYYRAIEQLLSVPQTQLNVYLRRELERGAVGR